MRTIVAGSRGFTDYTAMKTLLDALPKATVILSGTAGGADTLGERYAKENNIPIERYPADWKRLGRSAGYARNMQMAQKAERLIAFWDGKSPGTNHMINIARSLGLTVVVERAPQT